MTGRIFVKPAREGALVRQADRDMRPLAAEGEWVADSLLWRRLLMKGVVVEAKPPAEAPPEKAGLTAKKAASES